MCIKPERKGGVPNAGGARCPPRGRSRAGCAGRRAGGGCFCIGKEWGRHRCADTSGRGNFRLRGRAGMARTGLWNLPAAPGAARRRAGAGLYSNAAGQCRDGGAAAPVRVSPTGAGIARRRGRARPRAGSRRCCRPFEPPPKMGAGRAGRRRRKRAGRGPRLSADTCAARCFRAGCDGGQRP